MNDILKSKCESFLMYTDLMRDAFKWDGEAMHMMGASFALSSGWIPDKSAIRECEAIVKDNIDRFSPLRLVLRVALVCNMAVNKDPEEYLNNVRRAYDLIKISRRRLSMKYYLAAITLASAVKDKDDLLELVDRSNEIFDELAEIPHPFSGESAFPVASVFAAEHVDNGPALIRDAKSQTDLLIRVITGKPIVIDDTYADRDTTADDAASDADLSAVESVANADITSDEAGVDCVISVGDEADDCNLSAIDPAGDCDLSAIDAAPDEPRNYSYAEVSQLITEAEAWLRSNSRYGFLLRRADMRMLFATMLAACTIQEENYACSILTDIMLDNTLESYFLAGR